MTERYADVPGWRMFIAVMALLLLPPLMAAAVGAYALALLVGIYGTVGADGVQFLALIVAVAALTIALMLTRLCVCARRGRKLMVRHQRIALGLAFTVFVAPLTAWQLSGIWPDFPKAYWSAASVYALLGLWLAVDAWEDHGSV